jgi:hypothetical protein
VTLLNLLRAKFRRVPRATAKVVRATDDLGRLKTCYDEARKVVLKHLGNRYGRTFANHWEFVHYAQDHHLDLDFTTPPKRPTRP